MNPKISELKSILQSALTVPENLDNNGIMSFLAQLKQKLLLFELMIVDEDLALIDNSPEGVIQTIEIWCGYLMNFLCIEGRELESGEYECRIQPDTWQDMYRPYERREYTSLGRFYLVSYPDAPAQYKNNVASFIYQAFMQEAKTMYGDIDIISRETYHEIMGD